MSGARKRCFPILSRQQIESTWAPHWSVKADQWSIKCHEPYLLPAPPHAKIHLHVSHHWVGGPRRALWLTHTHTLAHSGNAILLLIRPPFTLSPVKKKRKKKKTGLKLKKKIFFDFLNSVQIWLSLHWAGGSSFQTAALGWTRHRHQPRWMTVVKER